jgi:NAD+ dependent glucose-6-phosphate dehydrogenase
VNYGYVFLKVNSSGVIVMREVAMFYSRKAMTSTSFRSEVDKPVAETKRVVYITGITGIIGRILVEHLADRYCLRGNSRSGTTLAGAAIVAGDISDADFMREQLQGVDTLVHLAGVSNPRADWEDVLSSNIAATYVVYEAARMAGVRRIIYASSNHVTGILMEKRVPMTVDSPVRPDGFYGVSKVFGETLGRLYADRYGISVLNLRIGWVTGETDPTRTVEFFSQMRNIEWRRPYPWMWLSVADCVRAFQCAIEAPPTIDFGTYYVMSANRGSLWDMSNTRDDLGYIPQDDLAALFDQFGVPYDFS